MVELEELNEAGELRKILAEFPVSALFLTPEISDYKKTPNAKKIPAFLTAL